MSRWARISRPRSTTCGRWPPATAARSCGGTLDVRKTVEVGHIFKLGYKYSESMGLRVLNADGKEVTPIMGSYGIGIERILAAAIELYHDKDGMILPPSIAPFDVVVTPANISDAGAGRSGARCFTANASRWASTPCWTTATSAPA